MGCWKPCFSAGNTTSSAGRSTASCPAQLPPFLPGHRAQRGSKSRQGGQCRFQPGDCPPWAGGARLNGAPPPQPQRRAGTPHMGETCWGCPYWAVIYSTPSLCPAPQSPTNSCLVQDLWHLQQADTFPTPVVNRGIKQRLCCPSANAQLCSARATKRLQGCWARPSQGHHPEHGRVDGVGVKSPILALPTSH